MKKLLFSKKIFVLSFILLLNESVMVYAQAVRQEWAVRYNGKTNKEDICTGVAVDEDGSVYITGYSNISGADLDFLTIKYTSEGKQKWLKSYGTPKTVWGVSMDQAQAITIDKNSFIYVTGWSSGNVRTDYATIKYSNLGKQQWVTTYTGKSNIMDEAYWIAVDENGNVYVTGHSYGDLPTSKDLMTTVKYNTLGKQKWIFNYDEKADIVSQPQYVRVDKKGNVYIVGGSANFDGSGEFDYTIIKLDSMGKMKWRQSYDGPGNAHDMAESVAIDEAGNVYVTGVSTTQKKKGKEVFATIKYNEDGNKEWEALYGGPNDKAQASANRIGVDETGSVYVGGSLRLSSRSENIAVVKYDSKGAQQWVSVYSGPENYDKINDMIVSKKGNVYVVGSSEGAGTDNDIITIRYDITGNKIWEERFNGPKDKNDYGVAICIDKNENIYVTGVIKAKKGKDDIITIKYSQNLPK